MKPTARPRAEAINWEQIKGRLARASAHTGHLTPEQARKVLEERAAVLARIPVRTATDADILELATFSLANESYAVETRYVREVVRLLDYTAVPGAPPFLTGVINLRGDILAVIDLRKFFGVVERGVTDLSRVLVLGGDRAEFGILTDKADQVVTLRREEVLTPPATVAGIGRDYLRGVTQNALIVLDGSMLLKDVRLFIDQDADTGA